MPEGGPIDEPALLIDCTGLRCPLPVIRLAQRVEEVRVGATIAVAADDPAARVDVPAWCRMRGHEYVGERADLQSRPVYVVRRLH